MRKQYHFRPSNHGYHAWDVDRLISLSSGLGIQEIPLSDISELDEDYWFSGDPQAFTCRSIAEHALLIEKANLEYPIIMCSGRRVMDGMHRVLKALNSGKSVIDAVIFDKDPEPDYTDVMPDDLPY